MASSVLCAAVSTGLLLAVVVVNTVNGNGIVLELKHKFAGRTLEESMHDRLDHDRRRLGRRRLSAVDVNVGEAKFEGTGIFYAKIMLGIPAKDYYPIIDSSTDLSWLYCKGCHCPTTSSFGFPIRRYDMANSSAAHKLSCDDDMCSSFMNSTERDACGEDKACRYKRSYDDLSTSEGYLVRDTILLNAATRKAATIPLSGHVVFGCGVTQKGELATSEQVFDGELGIGQSNLTWISQMVSQKLVKNTFSHCFSSNHKGGIFAIGEVDLHQDIPMTALVPAPDRLEYRAEVKRLDLGGQPIDISSASHTSRIAVFEVGGINIYFPEHILYRLLDEIQRMAPTSHIMNIGNYVCLPGTESINDILPDITLHFSNSAKFTLRPDQYTFGISRGTTSRCLGLQNSKGFPRHEELIIIGELGLNDKLLVYDLDKKEVGWTDYNCSDGVVLKDDKGKPSYTAVIHNIPVSPVPSAAADVGGMPSTALLFLSSLSLGAVLNFMF